MGTMGSLETKGTMGTMRSTEMKGNMGTRGSIEMKRITDRRRKTTVGTTLITTQNILTTVTILTAPWRAIILIRP